MGLRDQLNETVKAAMKAKDQRRLSTLRLITAAVKDRDIAGRTDGSREGVADDEILSVLAKMIKQREESAATYETGNRPELAAAERAEIEVIREFQPRQMGADEILAAAKTTIAETGAASPKDMGKVMAAMKSRYAGQMDFSKASAAVKDLLAPK